MKEKCPSLLAVRAKMGDEMTKREGEIDESGRVSLPEANALKRQRRERLASGNGRWETEAGDQGWGWGWARNRVGKDGCGWC